ncbi:MAG: hypothetical protein K9K30_14595 [Burkholderiaceae bacterium]|nr:hypothetical protein [Sulfuritalea sp.]MCF8176465.1 hypothetical protein [Burkholderiaceae bacterium]
MNFKVFAGLIGLIMLIAFLAPPVIKLQKLALAVVVLIGVAMAAYEFFENVGSKDD